MPESPTLRGVLASASKPPFTIMGSLGGVEAGLRQMRRTRPLETCEIDVGDGDSVVAAAQALALRLGGAA